MLDAKTPPAAHRIATETGEAFTILAGDARTGVLVVCDHASNAFPPGYGTLGVAAGDLERHIAYDIGGLALTGGIAERLGAPAVHTHFSRLLIDPNRGEDDPTLVMRLSDGAIVPGNRLLTPAERETRIARFHRPYHDAIGRVLDRMQASGVVPVILSIHTFTPAWKGRPRPWHAGVLWDQDDRLPRALIDALAAEGDIVVGDNEPYSGRLHGDTMWRHGTSRGLAHAIVEVRQDLVADAAGQQAWSERLARIMAAILADPVRAATLRRPPRPERMETCP